MPEPRALLRKFLWLLLPLVLYSLGALLAYWDRSPSPWQLVALGPYMFPLGLLHLPGKGVAELLAALTALTFAFYFLARFNVPLLVVLFCLQLANLGFLFIFLLAMNRG